MFSELTYPIAFPKGYTEKALYEYISDCQIKGQEGSKELQNYLKQDFKRFLYTLNLIPREANGKVLEIGANPYFTSVLVKKFTKLEIFCTNYFGENFERKSCQTVINKSSGEIFDFEFINTNIEQEDIPFKEKFDVILFCEVIEHLTHDPLKALLRIKKALKSNGYLILSTPNVSRLENVARMLAGVNIYDPYSSYGPYGRHNREYNKHELYLLLNHAGFEIQTMFSSDVHPNNASNYFAIDKFQDLIIFRKHDLGQYIFLRAINNNQLDHLKPSWLYRSYPEEQLSFKTTS